MILKLIVFSCKNHTFRVQRHCGKVTNNTHSLLGTLGINKAIVQVPFDSIQLILSANNFLLVWQINQMLC